MQQTAGENIFGETGQTLIALDNILSLLYYLPILQLRAACRKVRGADVKPLYIFPI